MLGLIIVDDDLIRVILGKNHVLYAALMSAGAVERTNQIQGDAAANGARLASAKQIRQPATSGISINSYLSIINKY